MITRKFKLIFQIAVTTIISKLMGYELILRFIETELFLFMFTITTISVGGIRKHHHVLYLYELERR